MASNNERINKISTIKIYRETKKRLNNLKEHERETYEDVLRKMLFILNISKKNPERAKRILDKIDRGVKSKRRYDKGYSEGVVEGREDKFREEIGEKKDGWE